MKKLFPHDTPVGIFGSDVTQNRILTLFPCFPVCPYAKDSPDTVEVAFIQTDHVMHPTYAHFHFVCCLVIQNVIIFILFVLKILLFK